MPVLWHGLPDFPIAYTGQENNCETGNDMADWEQQVNALVDGELDVEATQALKSAVADDQLLARTIVEAYELQKALSAIELERAPASLRKKLRRIPGQQRKLERQWFFNPRWAFALAVVPLLVLLLTVRGGGDLPSAEVVQGKRDLAVALAYFDKTNRRAVMEIGATIDSTMRVPVTENTARTLQQQFEFNREYKL